MKTHFKTLIDFCNGYNGSEEEFRQLIESNDEALQDSYSLFKEGGYAGSLERIIPFF